MADEKWGVQAPLKVSKPKSSGYSIAPGNAPLLVIPDQHLPLDEDGKYIPRSERRKNRTPSPHKVTIQWKRKR